MQVKFQSYLFARKLPRFKGLVVVKAINPLSNVSKGGRLCEVNISCTFPFSEIIRNSSPNKYSNTPASNSWIATVIDDLLYITINS